MKRMIIMGLLMLSMGASGQYQINLSGTITEGPSGFPVPDHPVLIFVRIGDDSLNTVMDEITTNDMGQYSYSFMMNDSYAWADISTPDCNGTWLSSQVYLDSNITYAVQDFTICSLVVCQALFTYEQTGDYTFQFLDQSTGQDLNYFWDFGDDNWTFSVQNPVHTYAAPGIYQVCLMINSPDSACLDVYCTQLAVSGDSGCLAQFSWHPDTLQNGFYYQFLDQSDGNITGWTWDFGDGTYSYEPNPVHSFPGQGLFEVCLSVSGPDCSSTWCEMVDVSPAGDCYNYFTHQDAGMSVLFTGNHFPGIPAQFSWDFGDGTTGEGQTVSHTYLQNGVYYVSLSSVDSMNCSAFSSQLITVGDTILFNQVYGQVFEGNFPMANGYVMISSIQNNPGFEPFTETMTVDSSGIFVFPYVPYGQYLLYAVPEDDNGYLPTYYGGVQHWVDAPLFYSTEAGMLYTIHLTPAGSSPNPGTGSITGYISESFAREDLLHKINVLLYNESFQTLAFTTVTPEGTFGFYGLADGLYYIYPELPGINSSLMPVEISELVQFGVVYLNFDGTSILGETERGIIQDAGTVFPNPASTSATLEIRCKRPGRISLQLSDITGRMCFSEVYQVPPGRTTLTIPLQDLVPGIYLVQICDRAGVVTTRKLIRQ